MHTFVLPCIAAVIHVNIECNTQKCSAVNDLKKSLNHCYEKDSNSIRLSIAGHINFNLLNIIKNTARGSTQVLLCLFPGVLWMDTSYIVSVHIQCQASIHTLSVCRGHSWRVRWLLPGTSSHLWFAGVRECPPWCSIVGATVTVHQFFCILHLYD